MSHNRIINPFTKFIGVPLLVAFIGLIPFLCNSHSTSDEPEEREIILVSDSVLFKASGTCVISNKSSRELAILNAIECSSATARAKLAEIVIGSYIKKKIDVVDGSIDSLAIRIMTEGTLKYSFQIGQPKIDSTTVTVTYGINENNIKKQ